VTNPPQVAQDWRSTPLAQDVIDTEPWGAGSWPSRGADQKQSGCGEQSKSTVAHFSIAYAAKQD